MGSSEKGKKLRDRKGAGQKTSPNRRQFRYCLNIVLLCALTLASLGGAAYFLYQNLSAGQEIAALEEQVTQLEENAARLYSEEEVAQQVEAARSEGAETQRRELLMQIQSDMESGGSTASMLRSLFSDDIVVVSGGKYYFYPVLDTVAGNDYASDDFVLGEDGRLQYAGDGSVRLQTGLDMSENEGEADFEAASEDDIAFVMVNAGCRLTADTGEAEAGEISDDAAVAENLKGAAGAGLGVGAIWTLGAVSQEEALEEAEHLSGLLDEAGTALTLPVAVSVVMPSDTDRTAGLGRAEWTANVITFCSVLEEAGFTPMIYGNLASFVMMLDLEELESCGYERWISNAGASLYFPYAFSMWQYSTAGTVQGIAAEVKLNALLISS